MDGVFALLLVWCQGAISHTHQRSFGRNIHVRFPFPSRLRRCFPTQIRMKTPKILTRLSFAVLALGSLAQGFAQNAPADFTLHSSVVATNPPRAGFNVEASPGHNISENIWTEDGGFSPMDMRWNFTATGGSANTLVVVGSGGTSYWSSIASGYFVGASARIYRFSGGAWSLLRTDIVTGYTAVGGSSNPADNTITFANSGPVIQSGDVIWLGLDNVFNFPIGWAYNSRLGSFFNTWNPETGTKCTLTYVPDGAPGSTYGPIGTNTPCGLQITSTTSESAGAWQYIQALYPNKETWESGHTYQVDIWLKQAGVTSGSATFSIAGQSVSHGFTGISGTWKQFTWTFPAPPGLAANAVAAKTKINFNGPGTLNVSQFYVHDAAAPAFTTDPRVLDAWKNFKPSTIRIWSGFSNVSTGYSFLSLESLLTPESNTRGCTNVNNAGRMDGLQEHLPVSLGICKQIGATPWIIANMSWSEQDWSHLVDYICAPASSGGYAAYRPSTHQNPYTDDFSTIYIEFGNEEWGTQTTGWSAHYGEAAHFLLSKATGNPNFNSKVKFIVNGFTGSPSFGTNAIAACPEATVVDYFNYTGSSGAGDAAYQSDLLALPSSYKSTIAGWISSQKQSAAAGHPYTIAVYEGGPGNDDPNSSGLGDNSLAAAVGALDVNLYGSLNGIGPQNLFLYHTDLNIYSSHTNISRGFIPHPSWEALQMRNNYCNGDMVAIDTNATPVTSDTKQYPLTSCYAFKDGNQADIVVISRDLNNATPVSLHLPTVSTGTATLYKLTGDPRSNNNTALNIPIQTESIPSFSRDYTFSMPPGSIYLFQVPMTWMAVPPVGVNAAGGSGQISLTWAAYTGATSYNIYRGTTAGGEGRTPYAVGVTGTTCLDSGVISGTTYYYKITAVVGGVETDQSSQTYATALVYGTVLRSNACGVTSGTLSAGWSYDAGCTGGYNYPVVPFINGLIDINAPNAAPAKIYANARAGHTSFTYTLGGLLPNSNYTARLHFAANASSAGYEIMNVFVNGVQELTNFDVYVAAGGMAKGIVEDLPAISDSTGSIAIVLTQTAAAIWSPAISGYQMITGTPQPATPVIITTGTLPKWTANLAGYNQPILAGGGIGALSYSVTSGTLPTGLSLDPVSGTIAGTPTITGTSSFNITVTDSVATCRSHAYMEIINPAVVINTANLANWASNVSGYSQTVAANGGTGTLVYSVSSGMLPTGLSLNPATGTITGTPTAAGSFPFTITVTDSVGAQASQPYTVTIGAVAITTPSLANWTMNVAGYSQTVSANGGTGTLSYAVSSGALPAGLGLNSSTGKITGTPTITGTSTFVITVTDGTGATGSQSYPIIINPSVVITTASLPSWTTILAYSQTVSANGGTGNLSFSVSSGVLPTGLSLSASTGKISGTPTATGTFAFSIKATDAVGGTGLQSYLITINPAVVINTATLANWTTNVSGYSQTVLANGGTGPFSYSVSTGSLPTGLSLSGSDGKVTGTPTATGTFTFTVKVTDNVGASKSQSYTVIINPAVGINTVSLANWTAYLAGYSQTVSASGGTGSLSYSVNSGVLPAGLSLSVSGGTVTGTPTTTGTSTFSVTATDSIGATASHSYTIVIAAAVLPATPTGLTASATNSLVTLTWSASSGATSYNVKRSTTSGSNFAIIASSTNAAYTDSAAASGANLFYVVSAVNPAGESPNSSQATVITTRTFQQWGAANNITGGATATPQNDGVPNLLKYVCNIDPSRAMGPLDRAGLPLLSVVHNGGLSYLTLGYRKNSVMTGIAINLQTSTNIQTWQNATPDIDQQIGSDSTTGDPLMQIGVNTAGGPKLFIRLNVTLTSP